MFRLEVILGPMYSGKSTELIRRISRFTSIETPTLCINHSLDSRTSDYIQTHNELKIPAIKTDSLMSGVYTKEEFDKAEVIGIDEAQFFGDLVEFVKMSEIYCYKHKLNKTIIVSGLDGDFNRKPFGQILDLIPLCDKVEKLTALDKDSKEDAIFTKRIGHENSQILVGAKESYIAVSRKNYISM